MAEWQNFFVAQVGAAAALAGLVFVGVSINLTKIMSYPSLPGLAGQTLIKSGFEPNLILNQRRL